MACADSAQFGPGPGGASVAVFQAMPLTSVGNFESRLSRPHILLSLEFLCKLDRDTFKWPTVRDLESPNGAT